MEIFTIGFTRSSAEDFFGRLKSHDIQRVLDVRLHNRSQLAGFAKGGDLAYFLRELVGADYEQAPLLAPSQDLFEAYRKNHALPWPDFEDRFMALMRERKIEKELSANDFKRRTVLLCSEDTPEHCHRRLVAEYLAAHWPDIQIIHL